MGKRPPRRRDHLTGVQARLAASQLKPAKLRVVACLLHHELGRGDRASMRGPEYMQQLNETAAALSEVADVYRLDKRGAMSLRGNPFARGSGAPFIS